jgi:peptide/nickel transport system ATP-binding protein
VTTQAQILNLLRDLQGRHGTAIVFITHDLGVIAQMARHVVVMYLGRVMEQGSVADIFHAGIAEVDPQRPRHSPNAPADHRRIDPASPGKTPRLPVSPALSRRDCRCLLRARAGAPTGRAGAARELLSLSPGGGRRVMSETTTPWLLEVRHLRKSFPIRRGFNRKVVGAVRAVDDVSFAIREGETLGLVGESGCGKTTTARCILRAMTPTSGEILFRLADGRIVDLSPLSRAELRPLRPQIQMIFQDPFGSLNPRMTIFDNVGEPLLVNGLRDRRARLERVAALLELTGLRPEYLFPHAFSGGQRQRIGIARALATEPRLVVADEPVSALDVSVQAQVLNLLLEIQARLSLTFLFVAHDLSVVKHISDRVAVMYVGQIVELATTAAIFGHPRHPYTAALMRAVPAPDPHAPSGDVALAGEVANPADPPPGCYFHPRCPFTTEACRTERPILREIGAGHLVRCHRAEELALTGI